MASIGPNDPRGFQGADFVGRFAYDVILHTLRVCGYDKRIVLLNAPDNIYARPNFVRIAAVSVLRLCLSYRDKWKANIRNLARGQSVYDAAFFTKYLVHIVENSQNKGKEALQLNVEITLALCNEMALFLISENKQFDLIAMAGAATSNIWFLIETPVERVYKRMLSPNAPPVNYKQELEKLFHEFENIWELERWIEDFMRRHAIPYGSRTDISAVFYRLVGRRWKEIVERDFREGRPPNETVIINLGFLPREAYDNIVAETSIPMPSYKEVAWGRKPSKSSTSSKSGTAEVKKSSRTQSTASGSTSRQTTQAGHSSQDSSKEPARGGQGSKDSSKPTAEGAQASKESSEPTAEGAQASEDSSEPTAEGAQASEDSSEQAAQSSRDSSDPGIVDSFSRMDLDAEAKSQASQGAVPKCKKPGK